MTEPDDVDDELLARLSDADPIDTTDLPTPSSPLARALLEEIMSNETPAANERTPEPTPDADDATPVLDLPSVEGIDRYAAPRRQRFGVIAAIAAVFVAIVGFVVVSPNGTEPALANVHSAARATAEVDSGRATTTFVLEANDGTTSETLSGEMRTEFSGTDVATTVDLDELDGEAAGLPANVEMRFVDGVVYGRDGDAWYAVETGGTFGQAAIDRIDPRNVLETVQSLVATAEVGTAEVDGVATTHYQSVIDLADASLRESGWFPVDPAEIEADGAMTIDLFVDDDGLLRRLVVSGDVVATDGSGGSGTVLVTSSFFDFGADIAIDAPATAQFIDPGNEELELDELAPSD